MSDENENKELNEEVNHEAEEREVVDPWSQLLFGPRPRRPQENPEPENEEKEE
ncbi:hypothetical protein [Tenuibacillus multivorans]|uniref:Uncharacterized protein n=1 Tax=Tenuibacillus multivorans TaxID=237069 RepID=A0A1H0CLX9_9BACI|nr:hypothetical protein [Tenuibacillus multivorans]GEL76245.1 hypothetical protein TMU01_04800 [Tenuibacillus multivorans]SDN58845.1 hypothetical protein SAMN05216498_2589 [Tenuibacillus multivorans]